MVQRTLPRLAPGDQEGAALLTVLLVTALITVMAVAMISRQQVDIRRTANIIEAEQAYWLAKGGESWATNLLRLDRQRGGNDSLGDEWAKGLPPVMAAGGMVAGEIVDLGGRFNLNNLVATEEGQRARSRERFGRLLTLCDMPPELTEAVVDFMDEDQDQGWAEDPSYLSLEPPYRTANRPLSSPSELLAVQGMTAQGFRCLEQAVSALPAPTAINVNTAPALVLASLTAGMDRRQAEGLVASRPAKGWATIADFLESREWSGSGLTADDLALTSDYFLVQCRTTMGRGRTLLFSLLERREEKVVVLQRTIGTY